MIEADPVRFDSELDRQFAVNIRKIRHALDMSQAEFAEALGFKFPSRLSELERCRNSVTLRQLEVLAKSLGVDPLDLLRSNVLPVPTKLKAAKSHA